jgi:hypothetical protein
VASSSFQRSPKKLGVKALVLPSLMGVKEPSLTYCPMFKYYLFDSER